MKIKILSYNNRIIFPPSVFVKDPFFISKFTIILFYYALYWHYVPTFCNEFTFFPHKTRFLKSFILGHEKIYWSFTDIWLRNQYWAVKLLLQIHVIRFCGACHTFVTFRDAPDISTAHKQKKDRAPEFFFEYILKFLHLSSAYFR